MININIVFEIFNSFSKFYIFSTFSSFIRQHTNMNKKKKTLNKQTGRGSFQSIVYGCINMFIDHGEDFSSKFFADMTLDEVVQFFSIPITEEKKIGDSGVLSQIVASELKSLCVNIQSVISQSGKKLQLLGFKDISSFVKYKLKEHNSNENAASFLISTLIETFPAFKDASPFRGKPQIFILKKVQLFVADLYRHFRKTNKLFEFGDINRLTVFADNVLPAVLREVCKKKINLKTTHFFFFFISVKNFETK